MPQQGGQSVAPYPVSQGGYGEPGQAPPPGFNMGYDQGPPPVMYQPGPVYTAPGQEYGGPPGAISPAPVQGPAAVPVGLPPGLEYLAQVWKQTQLWVLITIVMLLISEVDHKMDHSCTAPSFQEFVSFLFLTIQLT